MERLGFIRDMLDVKLLILFVMARAQYPLDLQKVYELCFQDDCLSYFDVSMALPQMVESGHLEEVTPGYYVLTAKGREQEAVTYDAIAYPVMQRARVAVEDFNKETKRKNLVQTEVIDREKDCLVHMELKDERSSLMTLELAAPNRVQGRKIAKAFEKNAESIFGMVLMELVDVPDND